MKKITSLVFGLIFIFCLSGCSDVADIADIFNSEIPYVEQAQNMELDKPQTTDVADNVDFAVHFIDVGQGDAALILCDNQSMLIDGGKAQASDIIYTYLKKQNITHLDYVICSHADADHVGGLSGALSAVSVGTVYAPKTEADTKAYQNFKRKVLQQNLEIQHPEHGSSFNFGSSKVKVLAPVYEDENDRNNSSIVLKIIYGSTSFLFTGDAEDKSEKAMIEQGYDLSANVLKVSHHGSAGATSYRFLREVLPEYAVISVGKNSYGHPTEKVLSLLRDAETKVYRTDLQGDIIVRSDGSKVTFDVSRNVDIDTLKP
ncbi:MAG: MBL fold metallo-hydrolase [Clostridia bacterium]|nr:MBL fold metallo-hydrolase [Clostridia bacterium]MCI8979865.1 MBL fold metallo-hydrolase [Clostridia bacterium]